MRLATLNGIGMPTFFQVNNQLPPLRSSYVTKLNEMFIEKWIATVKK